MKYKIKHKKIVKSYSADNVRFVDDLYILSYADSFSVISCRDGSARLKHGNRFFEIIDVEDRAELRSYVYSDSDAPLVLRTDVGTAMINKFLLPSTMIFLVSFLTDEKGASVLDVLRKVKNGCCVIPDTYEGVCTEIRGSRQIENEINTVLNNYNTLLEKTYVPMDVSPKVTVEKLYEVVIGIAAFAGCSVDVTMDAELICFDTFDLCAFKSFLLCMLMLARKESNERRASLEITCCGTQISVRVIFDTECKKRALSFPEIRHFFDFADRNNMLFESFNDDGRINVRICPTRKDWTLIEFKAPIDFDWDA